jgi:hypothetical protein
MAEKERTYRCGQWFVIRDASVGEEALCVLVRVDVDDFTLICVSDDCNRWTEPQECSRHRWPQVPAEFVEKELIGVEVDGRTFEPVEMSFEDRREEK